MSSRTKRSKSSYSKSQLASDLAAKADVAKSKVSDILAHLQTIAASQLKSAGVFTIPGIVKLTVKHKKATPARQGRNPFTGAEMTIKAKPARRVVRVRALKAMKDAV